MRIAIFGKRLDRYIFRQLLFALIAVTSGLTALIWLTQSLRFVELVVNHGLSFGVFLRLTGLLIPSFVAVILPITTFVVVQFVYQRLAGDRELTVMRAAGLSPYALARPAIALAVLATLACYALNLWLVPASLASFRQFQWEIRNRIAAFLVQEGVFTEISDGLTVYVRSRAPDGTLQGILVDDERDANAPATILAERGRLLEGPNGPRVLLLNGSRQEIDHQTGRLDILTFRENMLDLSDTTHQDSPRLLDISEASIPNLLDPPSSISQVDRPRWVAEAYKRLSSPFTALSYAFVALLFSLTGTFRRQGGFLRPLVSIGTVVVLLALGLVVDNLAARENTLIPLMWVQSALPGLVCAWLLLAPQFLWSWRRPVPHAN
ncbi:MAG TPA: LPS export ABC transporter permease LptF [Acetobacteraceae bacterium]|jgi:lipopolysaccharide export system permease protein|nr:LPS export ABC transporter permease LptF [Acetobacteraceae bacterium]